LLGIAGLSLALVIGVFVASAAMILFAGVRLARVADKIADRTGLGEVVAGAIFVGAATSLPGAITSVATAAQGSPGIAVGNALGGLTAQTAFLAVADLAYRPANLEHAAASVTGLAQGVLLVTLLVIPLIAAAEPSFTIWGVHPASVVILIAYAFGVRLLTQIKKDPMWTPVGTPETREEISEPQIGGGRASDVSLWLRFGLFAGMTAIAGFLIGESSIALVEKTALTESAVGTVFAAIANSLPELVTAIAAVRIGGVSLAVGDVIGGNAFEVLFLSAADLASPGSIYASFKPEDRTTALIAILMTGILLLGMLRREKSGFGGIGFESSLVLALYAGSVLLVLL
jgi:cation:H+ antiporter